MNHFQHPKPKPADTCFEMVVEKHSIRVVHTGDQGAHRFLVTLYGKGTPHSEVTLDIVDTAGFSLGGTDGLVIEVPNTYWHDVSRLLEKLEDAQLLELQVHYNFAEMSVSYFSLKWPAPERMPPDVRARIARAKGSS